MMETLEINSVITTSMDVSSFLRTEETTNKEAATQRPVSTWDTVLACDMVAGC